MNQDPSHRGEAAGAEAGVSFAALYDEHPEYAARRQAGSFEQAQIELEVREFKLPQLSALLPQGRPPASVLEIGCATGELIARFPVAPGGRRVGVDISAENVRTARERFPEASFFSGDFRSQDFGGPFDCVVMSDVLEHVPDDVEFLRDAAALSHWVLVNLPLEDNWLNRGRAYGPQDVSGHLRRYSLHDGLALFAKADLEVLDHSQVWIHETPAEPARRRLRADHFGQAYAGGWASRTLRRLVFDAARGFRPLGRRLFASNLFALARRRALP